MNYTSIKLKKKSIMQMTYILLEKSFFCHEKSYSISVDNSCNTSKYFNCKNKIKKWYKRKLQFKNMLTFSAFRRITDPDFLKSPSVWICSSKDVQASTRKLKEINLFRWPGRHLSKSYYSAKVYQQIRHYTLFRSSDATNSFNPCDERLLAS